MLRACLSWLFLSAIIAALGACADNATGEEPSTPTTAHTYYDNTKAILDARCANCHHEGAVAPFNLSTYEDVVAVRLQAAAAIEAGRMPPWKASGACRDYENDFSLADDQATVLLDWLLGGAPEGDPANAPPAPTVSPWPEPSLVLQAGEAYTPDADGIDDYRCLVMDHDFTEDTFVTGIRVVPDAIETAHHSVLFLVPAESLPLLEAKDLTDPGEGYTCFGSSGIAGATMIGGWAPGAELSGLFEPGVALVVPAGSKIVNQMHYNLAASDPSPDHTRLDVYTTEEEPEWEIMSTFILNTSIQIPADAINYAQEAEFPFSGSQPMYLLSAGAHMHLRGTSFTLTHIAASGEESCIVDVPDYDYNWQQQYRLPAGDELLVGPGDTFRLRCVYDNSAANQPVLDGVQVPPTELKWGDGTLDEMCLSCVMFKRPYMAGGDDGDACGSGVATCMSSCDPPGAYQCLANCASTSVSCLQCVLLGMVTGDHACAPDCLSEVAPQECAQSCIAQALSGEGMGDCMAATCPETLAAVETCIGPTLTSGTCDPLLTSCSAQ